MEWEPQEQIEHHLSPNLFLPQKDKLSINTYKFLLEKQTVHLQQSINSHNKV